MERHKRMGGITIVQDPSEASFDSMPASALSQLEVDHCLSAYQRGPLLDRLTREKPKRTTADIGDDRRRMGIEVSVAWMVMPSGRVL